MQNKTSFFKFSSLFSFAICLLIFTSCSNNAETATTETAEAKPEMEEEAKPAEPFFKLSLAQWSLHRALQAKELDNLDFPAKAKSMGFEGVEWVAHFFTDKATDKAYLQQMKDSTDAAGVKNLLIMIDGKGDLASDDKAERDEAIKTHQDWVDAAKFLGCHSIRVNLFGSNDPTKWHSAAVDGLGRLAKYGQSQGINVIVENHGGLSSDSEKLVAVMKEINLPNCGTLPDFGNFCVERKGGDNWKGECINEYDKYLGTKQMMPYAKAVSAKSYDFNENGQETKIDFAKMLEIVRGFKYDGFIGVEYEGEVLSEEEGIKATRDLLIKEAMKM
ncbi:MAG: sugar phosphate isomerase/epimerase [Saprospiraceae bacterium]|jgi:sugar phosphate isomerase/epimerase